jgi:hypothetical protein
MEYLGSCLCRKVKYKVTGNIDNFFLCHCGYCQKGSGSAHSANAFLGDAKLDWLSGAELIQSYKVPNSPHQRSFCTNCGSPLPYILTEWNQVVVPAGSVDTNIDKEPKGHIFLSKKANWDSNLHNLDQFDSLPE